MRRRGREIAGFALLAVLASAGVARAFTPTQDDRSIHVTMATPSDTLAPVPFQPFSEGLFLFTAGQVVATAFQASSFLAEGVVAEGSAYVEGIVAPVIDAYSILDVRFDLSEGSAFSLRGSLRLMGPPFASATFLLERLAPNSAVLISQSGASAPALLDQLVGMPAGSYRLRAAAESVLPGSSGQAFYDVDFQRVCASANPQDSDGDAFVDACDLCPLNFDPDQADTDGDGFGDACNDAVDGDGDDYADTLDNCPFDFNPDQIDADYDQDGDACDVPEVITLILDPSEDVVQNPTRAALASNGTAYVVSVTNASVYRIPPPAGPAVQLWSGAPLAANVADVAVGPDGFVYTAGQTSAKCYRIHPGTGAATLVIGPTGDGVGHPLTWANRVAVAPDGRVFVSGRDSQNVFEIAGGGAITQILGPSGNGTTSLGQPRALDVDADGNLYVLSASGSNERLFRVTPGHQVELLMSSSAFPNGISAGDLALGPDGSVYVSGGGVLARRPSGTVDVLLASGNATALDVDDVGVVHVVQSAAPTHGFRIPPTGPIGPLIDATGDGLGHPLQSASDVVVSDGPEKRIVVVGTLSNNAFLITDVSSAVVPLFGPAAWVALSLALLGGAAIARRR